MDDPLEVFADLMELFDSGEISLDELNEQVAELYEDYGTDWDTE